MAAATVQSSTNLFRRLAWNATVPLEIRLADAEGSLVDRYYVQAPRYTYLPLLLPAIRENLVELALDDDQLAKLDESQWWFEEDNGYAKAGPERTDGHFAPQGACKWNWPIDLIELHAAISLPAAPTDIDTSPKGTPTATPSAAKPLRLVLHLTGAPSDKLIVPKGIEACKTQFVNQVKEADFVRWGNTKRVTSLRRGDLEAGWDGVVGGDFDLHQRMASRIVPLPIPLPPGGSTISSGGGGGGGGSGLPSRPPSVEPGQNSSAANSGAKLESAYAARSLPLKIYLPDNAPAMQHVVAPISAETGKPTTLLQMLRTHLPQLFPAVAKPYVLAQPLAQGIVLPPDAEVAWLAACMSGADGWLRVGIRLVAE